MDTLAHRATNLRIGPDDRGRRMTLDEFINADFQEGWLYELARGVVEVTGVPRPWHGRIVGRVAELFVFYNRDHPGRIEYQASKATCAVRLPGKGLESSPRPGHLPRRGTLGPRGLDALDSSHRRRGRRPRQPETRLRHQARGIPARRRARILDPRPQRAADVRPRPRGRHLARESRAARGAFTGRTSSRAWKSGRANCSAPSRYNGPQYIIPIDSRPGRRIGCGFGPCRGTSDGRSDHV